jgi:hypothetical protein
MEKVEFVKGMSYLGVAIGKEYTQEECDVFYDFLKDYNYKVFVQSIKNRIKRSSFPPKINELIEECNLCNNNFKFEVIEFMKESGYFKATSEYDKAMMFVKRGIVPQWLKQDINEYYKRMNQKQIEMSS